MTAASPPAEREPFTGPETGDFDPRLALLAYAQEKEALYGLPQYAGPETGRFDRLAAAVERQAAGGLRPGPLPPELERLRVTGPMLAAAARERAR